MRFLLPLKLHVVILLVTFVTSHCPSALGQQVITTPDGNTITLPAGVDPSQVLNSMGGRPGGRPGAMPAAGPKKKEGEKEEKKDDKKEGEAEEKKEEGPPKNVTRTAEPPAEPDPGEFDSAVPDQDGLLRFQFRNQPWPKVLRWYADICNLSFDWQELPGDYINLSTQRAYSKEETGDMINRALLVRGFTMLIEGETLTVAKIEELNPALVPRVRPEELSSLFPHTYVRTSFALTWLLAEEVEPEFTSLVSKNGKLTALQSTNRLEAMDAAANLIEIHRILEAEQSAIALDNLAREFVLQHARAASVKAQLEAFLGIQSSSGGGGSMSSSAARMIQQQMQQMQQQMQQAAQRAQGGGAGGKRTRKRSEDVNLVANERSNSLIVHAPPNKMALIESFIKRVDVKNALSTDFQRMNTRMKVFRLASLSPGELVESLNAMDVLEPATRLQVDEDNNAIIAYASVADQYMIQSVIDRLDGSQRRFEVVQLRRLEAESVAGSIKFLMGADEEDDSSNNRNNYYDYFGYGYGSRSSRNKKTSSDKMRVGANVQDNQLLLWVNDIELDEVRNLLEKLGEIPAKGSSRSNLRMIDASRQPETYEYLKKLKEQWDKVSPNPLEIPDETEFQTQPGISRSNPIEDAQAASDELSEEEALNGDQVDSAASEATEPSEPNESSESSAPSKPIESSDQGKITELSTQQRVRFTQTAANLLGQTGDENAPQPMGQTQTQPPKVRIFLDEGGNLVLQSEDMDALDRLEQIMQANKPPKKPYDIFKVRFARASWVALNLREYFDKEENNRPSFFSFFGEEEEEERQLGDKPPLKFISDNDTKSIVVQGADDIDRQTIADLIELWDVPEEVDDSNFRYTELVKIRYSRAENIVKVIKEAYRDLLSANDKTFQDGGDDEDSESKRNRGGGSGGGDGGFSFTGLKGKLSLGADTVTNSILISTEGKELLEVVRGIIEELDVAAKTEGTVEVVKLSGTMNGRSLEKTLNAILGRPQKKDNNKQQQQDQQQNAEQQAAEQAMQQQQLQLQQQQRGRRGRDR